MFEFFGAKAYHICACDSTVKFRATKSQYSQIFSAFLKAYETSTNLISWGNPKLLGQKSQNLSLGQNSSLGQIFLAAQFFLFIDILLKPQ